MPGNIVRIIIAGDAKQAIAAMRETEVAADTMGGKLAGLGKVAALASVAVAAGVIGVGFALFKIGGDFQAATNTIRTKTGETGVALEGLKKSFDNVFSKTPASMDDVAQSISLLHEKLGLAGQPLEDLSLQFIRLSRITKSDLAANLAAGTDALNNWGVEAGQQARKLDELFRASQKSGVSFETLTAQLADSGAVFRGLGISFEQGTALMGTLGKAGVDVGAVMPGLKKTLAEAFKTGVDGGKLLEDTLRGIESGSKEAEKAAIKLFGAKSGGQLIELSKEGKLNYGELLATITSGSDTISQAAKDTSTWTGKLEILKHQALVALKPLAESVFKGVGDAITRVSPYVVQFIQWFAESLPVAVKAVQPTLERIGGALYNLGQFIITKALPGLVAFGAWLVEHKPILEGVAVLVGVVLVAAFTGWAISAGLAAAATLLAFAPLIAIGAVIAAVAAAVIWAYQNWDTFRNSVDAVASFMTDTLWPALQKVGSFIADVFNVSVAAAKQIWSDLQPAVESVQRTMANLFDNMKTVFGVALDAHNVAMGITLQIWRDLQGPLETTRSLLLHVADAFDQAARNAQKLKDIIPSLPGSDGFHIPLPGGGSIGIPGFASGGVVGGPVGSAQLAIVHGGERVLTPGQQGGGGGLNIAAGAIVINGNVDPQAVVEAIVAYERRNGTRWRS